MIFLLEFILKQAAQPIIDIFEICYDNIIFLNQLDEMKNLGNEKNHLITKKIGPNLLKITLSQSHICFQIQCQNTGRVYFTKHDRVFFMMLTLRQCETVQDFFNYLLLHIQDSEIISIDQNHCVYVLYQQNSSTLTRNHKIPIQIATKQIQFTTLELYKRQNSILIKQCNQLKANFSSNEKKYKLKNKTINHLEILLKKQTDQLKSLENKSQELNRSIKVLKQKLKFREIQKQKKDLIRKHQRQLKSLKIKHSQRKKTLQTESAQIKVDANIGQFKGQNVVDIIQYKDSNERKSNKDEAIKESLTASSSINLSKNSTFSFKKVETFDTKNLIKHSCELIPKTVLNNEVVSQQKCGKSACLVIKIIPNIQNQKFLQIELLKAQYFRFGVIVLPKKTNNETYQNLLFKKKNCCYLDFKDSTLYKYGQVRYKFTDNELNRQGNILSICIDQTTRKVIWNLNGEFLTALTLSGQMVTDSNLLPFLYFRQKSDKVRIINQSH